MKKPIKKLKKEKNFFSKVGRGCQKKDKYICPFFEV